MGGTEGDGDLISGLTNRRVVLKCLSGDEETYMGSKDIESE